MNIIIHDRKESSEGNILKDNSIETVIISDNGKIQPCVCCFDCWVKTPGQCVIKDGYDNMGMLLSKCSQLIIISQCFYGGFSPFVKNVLDRCVCPYQLPYFTIINGVTRHPKRYKNKILMSLHFYGNTTENEKETAKKLADRLFYKRTVSFYNSFDEIKGV